jgi:hypothetical protein
MPQEYKGPRGVLAREYGRRSNQGRDIRLALRRNEETGAAEWTAVRGQRLKVEGWPGLKLFSYRDGLVAFIVEEGTGITLAIGSTTVKAKGHLRAWLAGFTPKTLAAELAKDFADLNPGDKPEVKRRE